MSSVIVPTVGRKIWFFPAAVDQILRDGDQPLDASIVGINATRIRVADLNPNHVELGPRLEIEGVETTRVYTSVNLAVWDFQGRPFTRPGVQIWNGHGDKPEGGFAEWMPYQQGQAKAAAALDMGGMDAKDVQSNLRTLFRQQADLRESIGGRIESLQHTVNILAQSLDELRASLGEKPAAVADEVAQGDGDVGEAIGTGDAGQGETTAENDI